MQSSGQLTVFSRSVPQHSVQISPCTPGQKRRGVRTSQITHFIGKRGGTPLSYHWVMARTDLYLKIVLDLPETEKPEKHPAEIWLPVKKIYGVPSAEVQK